MANYRSGNIHFVDSTGALRSDKNVKVAKIIITATGANAVLELRDSSDTNVLMELRNATSGTSQEIDFLVPALFPNGVYAHTLTNAKAVLIYTQGSGQEAS